jgi:AcrR family transcriptional regulator
MDAKPAAKPRTEKFEKRLDRIIRTAAVMFTERGYDSTSLDEIAERLKIHKATLYHYVDSKEEILYRCLAMTLEDLQEALAFVRDSREPALVKLRTFFVALIKVQTTDLGRCLCLVGPKPLGRKASARILERQRELDRAVRGIFEQGLADGSLRGCDPRLATAMLFGAFNWVANWYKPSGPLTPEAVADAFLTMMIDGVAAR